MGLEEALASLQDSVGDPVAVLQKWDELEAAYAAESNPNNETCFQAWILEPNRIQLAVLRSVAELKYDDLYKKLVQAKKTLIGALVMRLRLEGYWVLFLGLGEKLIQSRQALETMIRIMKRCPRAELIELINALQVAKNMRKNAVVRGLSTDMSRFTTWDATKAEEHFLRLFPTASPEAKPRETPEVAVEDGMLLGPASFENDQANDHDQSREFTNVLKAHLTRLRADDPEIGSPKGEQPGNDADIAKDDDHERDSGREKNESSNDSIDLDNEVEIGRGARRTDKPESEYDPTSFQYLPPFTVSTRGSSPAPSIGFSVQHQDSILNAQQKDDWGVTDELWLGQSCVTRKDFLTLEDGMWINDEIVNAIATLLLENERNDFYCMSTFFFESLSGTGDGICYAKVEGITKNIDIFAKKYLLVPVNQTRNHWLLAIVVLAPFHQSTAPSFQIYTLDSFAPDSNCLHASVAHQLSAYLVAEAKSKQKAILTLRQIKWIHAEKAPQQHNSWDCGVYMLAYLRHFVKDPKGFLDTVQRTRSWDLNPLRERARLRRMLLSQLQSMKDLPSISHDSESEFSFQAVVPSMDSDTPGFALGHLAAGLTQDKQPRIVHSPSRVSAPVGDLVTPPASFLGPEPKDKHQQSSSNKEPLQQSSDQAPAPAKVCLASPLEQSMGETSNDIPSTSFASDHVLPMSSIPISHETIQDTGDFLITQRLAMEQLLTSQAIALSRRDEFLENLPNHTYSFSCDHWAKVLAIPVLGDVSILFELRAPEGPTILLPSSCHEPRKRHHEESAFEEQRLETQLETQARYLGFSENLLQLSQDILLALESFHSSQIHACAALYAQVLAEEAFRDTTLQEKHFDFYREKWMADVTTRIAELKTKWKDVMKETEQMKGLYMRVLEVRRSSEMFGKLCQERLEEAKEETSRFTKEKEEKGELAGRKERKARLGEPINDRKGK